MYSNYFLGVKSPDFFLITISLSLSDLYNLFALPCMFIPEISVYQFTQIAKSMRGCRIFIYFYRDGGGGGPSDNYIVWGRGKSETYFWLFDCKFNEFEFSRLEGGGGEGSRSFRSPSLRFAHAVEKSNNRRLMSTYRRVRVVLFEIIRPFY